MIRKNILTTLFFILLFILGYIRETLFLVVNSVLLKYPFPYNRSYITPPEFLQNLTPDELISIKWLSTFGFSALFCFATAFLIHYYFKRKLFLKITFLLYIGITCFSGTSMLLGYMLNDYNYFYPLARFLMGLLQYPLFSLILFVLFYYSEKIRKNNT